MTPNQQFTGSGDITDALVERAILQVAEKSVDEDISAEQLGARAQMRFAELFMAHQMGYTAYMAETVSETLIEVAAREVDGIDKVIDESLAKLERTFGAPDDGDAARAAVYGYIEEVHGLPRAGSAGPNRDR